MKSKRGEERSKRRKLLRGEGWGRRIRECKGVKGNDAEKVRRRRRKKEEGKDTALS